MKSAFQVAWEKKQAEKLVKIEEKRKDIALARDLKERRAAWSKKMDGHLMTNAFAGLL